MDVQNKVELSPYILCFISSASISPSEQRTKQRRKSKEGVGNVNLNGGNAVSALSYIREDSNSDNVDDPSMNKMDIEGQTNKSISTASGGNKPIAAAQGTQSQALGSAISIPGDKRRRTFLCQWKGCGEQEFDLMDHINTVHIGVGRAKYDCQWEGCERERDFIKRPSVVKHMRRHLRPLGVWFKAANYSSLQVQTAETDNLRVYDSPGEGTQSGNCEMSKEKLKWRTYGTVWATISDNYWWPAQIVNPFETAETRELCCKDNAPIGSIMVRFYGTQKLAWMHESGLADFKDSWNTYNQRSTEPLFVSAIEEAVKAQEKLDSTAKQETAPQFQVPPPRADPKFQQKQQMTYRRSSSLHVT
eukprot:CFRG2956T1